MRIKTATNINNLKLLLNKILSRKDLRWSALFVLGLLFSVIWNAIFLNDAAFSKWLSAIVQTYLLGLLSLMLSLSFGWLFALGEELLFSENKFLNAGFYLFIDLLKSIPQIVIILLGYIPLFFYFDNSPFVQTLWLALVLALSFANDVYEEISNRIAVSKNYGFYNAMLALGIKESRIINRDVLLLNSAPYLINRAVVIFASSVFLLTSADFIVSVGLAPQLTLSGLPATLGNILATATSKEDILAIREVFADPLYLKELLTTHLQGISAAFALVFTMISAYEISNGIVERKKLNA